MTTSEQARADAMADAETFLEIVLYARDQPINMELKPLRMELWRALEYGAKAKAEAPYWISAGYQATDAARAAFRAVPGLRG